MRSRLVRAAALVVAVVSLAGARAAGSAPRRASPGSAFSLFAQPNALMDVNRVQCNINSIGEQCVDATNSPAYGGGFWPKGTVDNYVYNGGLQVAAIIPGTDGPDFPWPGDTVGAFFFDARGVQAHGSPVTQVYDSRRDLDNWPDAAVLRDPALYAPALLGRASASEQDSWVRYWDGDVNLTTGRPHPMGLLVEQRTLAWNNPVGNEDILYTIYRLINVTAADPARYAGLSAYGYTAADIADIAQLGRVLRERVRSRDGVEIPDTGFTFSRMYVGYGQDADVGNASFNYVTASLPFGLMAGYKTDFLEPEWQYPPSIFAPPFAQAPGFVAEMFLMTPGPAGDASGVTLFTNTTGGGLLPERQGVSALWRLLSGNLLATDGTCSVPLAQVATRHVCQSINQAHDARGYLSTTPFTVRAGDAVTLVMAQVYAAPVAAAVAPFIGGNMAPGFPVAGPRLVQGLDTVRNVDRAMGWLSHTDADGDGAIGWNEVVAVPRSLLWKAQLAHAVLDAGFLMPSAPEPPEFFAVPGDGRATVVWRPSATEQTGDAYFAAASNAASRLYDPDYREFDVEGYRIWRGTSPSTMQVIAQFDYAGTAITDHTGFFAGPGYGIACAPELGVTASCPALPHSIPLGSIYANQLFAESDVIQVRPGDRVQLSDGSIVLLRADTAVTGGNSGHPKLLDTGVPFVFIDSTAQNGVPMYYGVTAFDVNSYRSAASSLASPLVPKVVTPRIVAGNTHQVVITTDLVGDDGVPLDPTAPFPAMDAVTGTFGGPIPPANVGRFTLPAGFLEALPPGDITARIDSVSAGFIGGIGEGPTLYLTLAVPDTTIRLAMPMSAAGYSTLPSFSSAATTETAWDTTVALVPYDAARAERLGVTAAFAGASRMQVHVAGAFGSINAMSFGTALSQGRYGLGDPASRYLSHSRWFDESAGVEPPDPTLSFAPSGAHNSGSLSGVASIWSPAAYRNPMGAGGPTRSNVGFRGYTYGLTAWYPADFVVTWGNSGAVTVRDATHHVNLPHATGMGTGYGFVSLAAIQAAGVTAAQITDGTGTPGTTTIGYHALYTVDPVCRPSWWDIPCVPLAATAVLAPLDLNQDGVSDGNGIVIVINGEPFFMQMNALPAVGTQWHLRAVGGRGMSATCTPALPSRTAELLSPPTRCSSYAFTPLQPHRLPLAPGLTFRLRVVQAFEVTAESGDLDRIHTVPDPYYYAHSLEVAGGDQRLRFVNLPDRAIVRIYSVSGVLVAMVSHNDPSGGGEAEWDLRSRTGRRVASGVYFYHVATADGREKIGRFTVVNRSR